MNALCGKKYRQEHIDTFAGNDDNVTVNGHPVEGAVFPSEEECMKSQNLF